MNRDIKYIVLYMYNEIQITDKFLSPQKDTFSFVVSIKTLPLYEFAIAVSKTVNSTAPCTKSIVDLLSTAGKVFPGACTR